MHVGVAGASLVMVPLLMVVVDLRRLRILYEGAQALTRRFHNVRTHSVISDRRIGAYGRKMKRMAEVTFLYLRSNI